MQPERKPGNMDCGCAPKEDSAPSGNSMLGSGVVWRLAPVSGPVGHGEVAVRGREKGSRSLRDATSVHRSRLLRLFRRRAKNGLNPAALKGVRRAHRPTGLCIGRAICRVCAV